MAIWDLGVLLPSAPPCGLHEERLPSVLIPVCTSPTFATWLPSEQVRGWDTQLQKLCMWWQTIYPLLRSFPLTGLSVPAWYTRTLEREVPRIRRVA